MGDSSSLVYTPFATDSLNCGISPYGAHGSCALIGNNGGEPPTMDRVNWARTCSLPRALGCAEDAHISSRSEPARQPCDNTAGEEACDMV